MQKIKNAIESNMQIKGANWSTMHSTTIGTTSGLSDSYDIDYNNFYELELKNGNRVVLKLNKTLISTIVGSSKYEMSFSKTFPFITL